MRRGESLQCFLSPGDNNSRLFEGLKVGYKVWLEKDGVAFGDGLFKLLLLIDKFGSISRAADAMDMSYRAAWGKIKTFEKQWGISLVLSRTGGQSGGGTVLTPEAKKLVNFFRCFQDDFKLAVEKVFRRCLTE